MSLSKIAGVLLSSAALVAGHGYVTGAVVDGTYYGGYLISQYPYESNPPETIGWSETATDLGFVDGSSYSSGDIICHKGAKPGAISAPVKAGGSVELQWSEWPSSHHGPVLTYMANCNGDCSSVDKTTLKFFKIDEAGLIDDSSVPGTWASDNLIKNNNSRTITIPSTIESGNYVLRHEIIALHSSGNKDGAQNYPQCFNLKVTGGGSDSPSGTLGTALYKDTDPGILVNIYQSLSSYTIPGPALYTGAASSSGSTTSAASVAATTTAAPSSASSSVASVGVISSASPVSATPIRSPSSIPPPHPYSTRVPRPSHSRRPGHGAAPSGRPHFSQPSGPEDQPATASTVTDYATATEYATATIAAQFTDSPNVQTPSADDSVTVTASAGGQSAASSTPASSSSGSSSSSSGSSSSGSTSGSSSGSSSSSSSGSSSYNSGDWSSYLSSLSADQFLSMLRETTKWLVSDKKVHARDLTV